MVEIRERRLASGDVYGREIPPPGGQVNDKRIFFKWNKKKKFSNKTKKKFIR